MNGKNGSENKLFSHNEFNINDLWKLLIFSVFATHFAVGCFYASYERHFVKKIQNLFSSIKGVHHQFYQRCFMIEFHRRIMTIGWFYKLALLDFELIFEVKMQEREGV